MEPLISLKKVKDEKKTICRICLNSDYEKLDAGLSLFEEYKNVYVYEKINYITNIEIKADDNLPNRICSTCLVALDSACSFKQQCETSDAILHSNQPQLSEALKVQSLEIPIKTEVEDDCENNHLEECASVPVTLPEDVILKSEDPIENEKIIPLTSQVIVLNLECQDCGTTFKSESKLRVHRKNAHLQQQLTCPICKKVHKTYQSLQNHMMRRTKACITASKIHVEGEGKNRMFHCKDCEYKTNRIHYMTNHLVIHSGERPHICNICGQAFTQMHSLIGHKESAHSIDIKQATCPHCGKHIVGRTSWYSHMKIHSGGPQSCKECGKTFATKASLKVHMKRHSGVKSLSCELCAKTFYTSSDLRNHKMTIHFKSKVYLCQRCGYKTQNCSLMAKHRTKHTENNVACSHCGIFVDNEQQLIIHKERHYIKYLTCSVCDKKYDGRKTLSAHLRKVHKIYASEWSTDKIEVEIKLDTPTV